ncbi:MAG: PP2C family protein-serine/threonine phosphatase, partial [Anaerolineae bacterium]
MDSDMDKKKTPDTDDLDANTPESETEEKVDAVSLEEEVSIGESIKTAPLTFIQEKRAQAPTVISKGKPAKPEPELKMWVAARCNLGAIRDRNEDSCLVYTSKVGGHFTMMPFGLYIVADGMGGHANGHIASKTASRMMARNVINKIYMPLLEDKPNSTPIQEVMADAVRMANTAVYEIDESDSGTTLTTALILGRRLHVAHVGDSRIYLMTEGELEAVTEDHSLVHRLQEVGQLTAEEATIFQYRHVLLRALGQTE